MKKLPQLAAWMQKFPLPSPRVKRLWLGFFFLIANSFLLSTNFMALAGLKVGAISSRDIRAPKTVSFVDQTGTEQMRLQAEAEVTPVYTERAQLTQQNVEALKLIFHQAEVQDHTLPAGQRKAELAHKIPFALSENTLRVLVHTPLPTLALLKKRALQILTRELERGVKGGDESIQQARANMAQAVNSLELRRGYRDALKNIVEVSLVAPNYVVDIAQTKFQKDKARKKVPPVVRTIEKGALLVRKGERFTPEAIQKLEALGLTSAFLSLRTWGSVFLFSLVGVVLLSLYLRTFERKVYRSPRDILLLLILFTTAMAGVRGIQDYLGEGLIATMPILAVTFLFALIVPPGLTLLLSMLLALQAMWTSQGDINLILFVFPTAVALTLALKSVESRAEIFRAAMYVAGAGWAVLLARGLIQAETSLSIVKLLGWGGFSVFVGGVIAVGCLYFIERFFGVVTPMQLLELGNPNHPLLRRLMREAPGTYNHSMYVANLAEAAAQEIGVNRLLARVGAYYHDIGKTVRPYLFIENQLHMSNLHESLPPRASAEYVRAHVTDGLQLGRQYRLPECLLDFIPQHHGTMRISFFYDQLGAEVKEQIPEEEFRYPGPRPQYKETALVMLADGVEASVRAMEHPTSFEKIESQVAKILDDRLRNGQLDESCLTLTELQGVKRAFLHILSAMYHPRVPYPEAPREKAVSK